MATRAMSALSQPLRWRNSKQCIHKTLRASLFGGALLDYHICGYYGTETEFKEHFGAYLNNKQIIFDLFTNFPVTGSEEYLYFDLDEKILYYWDNEYIPVNAMLIANTIIEGGEA